MNEFVSDIVNYIPSLCQELFDSFLMDFVLGLLNGEFWRAELREAADNVAKVASQSSALHL